MDLGRERGMDPGDPMTTMQFLFTVAACSAALGWLQWCVLHRRHSRMLARLQERHRRQQQAASQMLTQCRRQIRQLQQEMTNMRAPSPQR
jgi:TolA-binding protein